MVTLCCSTQGKHLEAIAISNHLNLNVFPDIASKHFDLLQSLLPQECFTRSAPWCLRLSTCVWWYNDNNCFELQSITSLHQTCKVSMYLKFIIFLRRRAENLLFAKLIHKMLGWPICGEKSKGPQNATLASSSVLYAVFSSQKRGGERRIIN